MAEQNVSRALNCHMLAHSIKCWPIMWLWVDEMEQISPNRSCIPTHSCPWKRCLTAYPCNFLMLPISHTLYGSIQQSSTVETASTPSTETVINQNINLTLFHPSPNRMKPSKFKQPEIFLQEQITRKKNIQKNQSNNRKTIATYT